MALLSTRHCSAGTQAKEEIINDIVENKQQFRMDTHDDNEEKEYMIPLISGELIVSSQ